MMPTAPVNGAAQPMMNAGYRTQSTAVMQAGGYGVPMTQAAPNRAAMLQPPQQPAPLMNQAELMTMLKDSLYPSQREWAADQLTSPAHSGNPAVVDALVTAAQKDPAPLVRAGCVHSLAKMKSTHPAVVAALQALRGDVDPRVQKEANQALAGMTPTGTTPVQPAGYAVPR